MKKINMADAASLNVVFLYAAAAAVFISAAHLYSILNPQWLLAEPVTGGLIVWTHLHTLGAITPLFMGLGFYNLRIRYNAQIRNSQILHHFLMLYISLPFFLFFVYPREGSPWLTIFAFLVFSSAAYYIYIYAKVLKNVKKENRKFEFWTDAVSLYFLFQAVLFGFALAANLSYGFFRRDILSSIKLHSHSGIAGYWMLQYINMIYRSMSYSQGRMNKSEEGGKSADTRNKYLKYAVISLGVGVFVWTSVHDRFAWAFYTFYFSVASAVVFLLLHWIQNKSTFKNISFGAQYYTGNLVFISVSVVIAGIMIFSNSENLVYQNHLPFIYMYTIFYGIFVFAPIFGFLNIGEYSKLLPFNSPQKALWAHRIYLALAVSFAVSVMFENLWLMRFLQLLMLFDFLYICFFVFQSRKLQKSPL